MTNLIPLAQAYSINSLKSSAHSSVFLIIALIALVVAIFEIASVWKVYKKANQPGWASIIPVYSSWVEAKVGGKPGWLGLFIVATAIAISFMGSSAANSSKYAPIAAILWVISFLLYVYIFVGIANNFGKTKWFGLLLVILPFIGFPILGFGPAQYKPIEPDDSKASP
jgi:hypothetical protein